MYSLSIVSSQCDQRSNRKPNKTIRAADVTNTPITTCDAKRQQQEVRQFELNAGNSCWHSYCCCVFISGSTFDNHAVIEGEMLEKYVESIWRN